MRTARIISRGRGPATWAALASSLLLAAALPLLAQGNDDCLMCHEDPDLTGEHGGREISVHVDADTFTASVHGELDCTVCHQDLDGAELPHEDELERVDCSFCHEDSAEEYAASHHGKLLQRGDRGAPTCAGCHGAHDIRAAEEAESVTSHAHANALCGKCHASQARQHASSLHGQAAARGDEMAPTCYDCHDNHQVRSHTQPDSPTATMNIPVLCGKCHREGSPVSRTHEIPQDRILENYSMSIHGEGLYRQGLTVTAVCTSCHTAHLTLTHDDARSSIHRDNITGTCTQCHASIERVHRKVVEGRLWEEEPGKIPVCIDCHSPHKIRRVFYAAGAANQDCLACHAQGDLTMERGGETVSLYVDEPAYNASMHAGTPCAQCHTDVDPSVRRACETIVSPVDCSVCHAEVTDTYRSSIHGVLHARADPDAPDCLSCHSKHATLGKTLPISPTFPRNVPLLCAACHRAGEQAAVRIETDIPDIYASYVDSIHGKGLLESGLVVTATCASCHTAHGELPPSDPGSSIHHDNISDTCGACHHGIEETFSTSIHWPGNAETDEELPTCEDCHSSHSISRTDRSDFRFRMMDQCGRCHENEAETFFDTFHGKVSRLGSSGAAKCYDCHGTHAILPTSDARSTLSRERVVDTCGQCHTGAHRRFAGYLTHATHHDPDKYPYLWASFWLMTVLLLGTLTFALLHTLAWLVRLWLSREQWREHKRKTETASDRRVYRRFDRTQRVLHLIMLVSFFALAITGMILKFSYMGWARVVALGLGGFETTGVLHRLAAVTLFTIFFVHLWDVRRRKLRSGKSWKEQLFGPDSMLFNLRDLKEATASMKWFFGLGPRPKYGRYTYWEKFDYFAVFWGVFVIGFTGLILWFPEIFTHILPGWSVNVATIIHSDEALLAVGFIFTVHFFNTHFRPDKFPMDPVIFTGRVSLEELKYDKPREYESLVASGELESRLVKPFPAAAERAFRIFGFVALGVGLTLIALIVYAMLFGYR